MSASITIVALTAVYCIVAGLSILVLGLPPQGIAIASGLLAVGLIVLSGNDIASFRLPDAVTLPLGLLGLASIASIGGWEQAAWHLLAAAVGFALLEVLNGVYRRLRGRDGLGGGDSKLLAAAGAWVGLGGLPTVALVACATACLEVVGRTCLAGERLSPSSRIAFGPHLAIRTLDIHVM